MILKYALLSGGLDCGSLCTGHRSSEAKLLSIKLSLFSLPINLKYILGAYNNPQHTVKPVLSGHSKKDKTMNLMTNGS